MWLFVALACLALVFEFCLIRLLMAAGGADADAEWMRAHLLDRVED